MWRGVRAVVFDLDDTLYPEREHTLGCARAAAERLAGLCGQPAEEVFDELRRLFEQEPLGPMYDRWLERRPAPARDRWLAEALRAHRTCQPRLTLEPSTRAVLQRLRNRFALGLVSDGRFEAQRAKVAALGVDEALDVVVLSDELGASAWKPSPAPYLRALAALGVAPAEAVYVGDNPAKDFLGARRAGMRSIRLRRPDGLHRLAEPGAPDAAPDAEIAQLACIETLLG